MGRSRRQDPMMSMFNMMRMFGRGGRGRGGRGMPGRGDFRGRGRGFPRGGEPPG